MGEARRKEEYLRSVSETIEKQEKEAPQVPVKCIRCGTESVAVDRTGCACGGTFIAQAPQQPRPAVDPLSISTEVYLLDALLAHAQTVVNQLAFRGKIPLAQTLTQLCGPIAALRQQVDADTRSGIVLAGPGAMPHARG